MTLDELIKALMEAKDHCVDGRTEIKVYSDDTTTTLNTKPKLLGNVYFVDFNDNVNLYIAEL